MRGLLEYVMRHRMTALTAIVAGAILPLFAWLSVAVLALVGLRRGWRDALLLTGMATVFMIGASLLQGLTVWWGLAHLLAWLPTVGLAAWLRWSVSLSSTLQLAGALAIAGLMVFHLFVPDPVAYFEPVFRQFVERLAAQDPAVAELWQARKATLLGVLPGLWVLSQLLLVVLGLLLGRYWQALLYNPGGFGEEFRNLRLRPGFALLASGLMLAAGLSDSTMLFGASVVAASVFVFPAFAVAHAVVARFKVGGAWLVPVYLGLLFMPYVYVLFGLMDVFVNWRRLFGVHSAPPGNPD